MRGLMWVVVAIVVLIGGFYLFNNYIYEEKQGENTYEPYRAMLSGEYLCLPHVDTSGPQTLECAFGLKTDDGTYYALDFNLMSQAMQDLQMGERISASGVVTPIERLSTDHWQKYPIVGIFSVTDSLVRGGENPEGESAYGTECHDGEQYFVITRGRADVGEDILVKAKVAGQTIPCRYTVVEGDAVFTSGNPTYFLDIEKNFLLLDEGTAPPPRGLKVYDLKLKTFVYADMYSPSLDTTNGSVVYWQSLPTPATVANCPQYQEFTSKGLGAGLEREVVLTLATLKVSATGKERCSARQ